ncbi:S41 family peptidase [Aestuariivivens insulae]|uniref:S41 family peptidase n=1 Tax=Aestuariivivens insulae TaxID=1621988 RepID=UPI001F569AFE|nr:S41 family peptidase [Aestuariivivens insulae]
MKRSFLLLLILSHSIFAQKNLNLDFEILEDGKAKNWSVFGDGDYSISYEQLISKSGNICASIKSNSQNVEFNALSYKIPADFGGKKIKLTGYIKTENVSSGWAGLWMRIDPYIAFDNMKSRGITGTTEWKKYEIELSLNNNAKTIVFGGILAGTGKIWVDNLKITVDGKSLENTPKKVLTKPQLDTEFDTGSKITFLTLDENQINNLDLLGRIWGFLKYYHPAIGGGNYNWDYELFRFLPNYQKVKPNKERDSLLTDWIKRLGELKPCKSCKETSKEAFLKPDLAWIDNKGLSNILVSKLKYIQTNRHQGDQYYISMIPNVNNPKFTNENPYYDMKYPDAGFRLLALYRYWNMIQYFFPYKHLIDKDWNSCLIEYIPKFINADSELKYELAALQIIADIKDTHANLWGGNNKIQEQRGNYYPPFHVCFVENKLVIDDYFNPELKTESGLEIGDVITHVNGKAVETFIKENHNLYPASNQPTRLRNMSFDILRANSNTISITYTHNNKSLTKDLKLYNKENLNFYFGYKKEPNGKSYKMLDNNIGYITLKYIKKKDIDSIKSNFKNARGIIVDIRNYPSAFVPFSLGNFLNSNRTNFVKFTQGNKNNPGEFTFRNGRKVGIDRSWSYKGKKVVVLVNEHSQSQSEYTAMAFKAGNKTIVMGSTTAGADGNVSKINLPGGLQTMISGIGVYYPDGTETQRVGIIPDIEVKPTIKGIKEGRDEVLEKAIEYINTN